ncbi:HIBADH: 3-hydroxyisobutyrate dehydrogenase [Tepidimonas alkaliphilus]|uniref:HIBADH: 3-hydroxyisobutyrate dehydrogenase n=1 Tax=Tepidimonas alkaliphilus TaxID=2588942 RepID=A0A554W8H5_9BURK|nr:NAD(P)-dependent oxidoreductase [Tepidimonas alkaliphilus]TSE19874.1 HIBADH: 3-hydroxyisobutyrate dehydrogenase [Tepidimonas alkaliphilus]
MKATAARCGADDGAPGSVQRVGLLGLGEVGTIFARALAQHGLTWLGGWDVKLAPGHPEQAEVRARAREAGAEACADMAALCAGADLIICAVTAANAVPAARQAAAHLRPGTWWLDLNSASPAAKQEAAAIIEAAGGRYVEAAVMTSVPPYGIRVPMLVGGPHAAALLPALRAWGMQVELASARLGVASATKMCRSIMIKGLEALVIESYTAARHYGVEDAMLATLRETFPGVDWEGQGGYFFQRVAQHGRRRAEEMREVARTVREAGLAPLLAEAIARKDDEVADARAAGVFNAVDPRAPWRAWADALLAARRSADGTAGG